MKINLLILGMVIGGGSVVWGEEALKQISLSFDDAPRQGTYFTTPARASMLLSKLKDKKVSRVMFYSVTSRWNPKTLGVMEAYAREGHGIANHTHSHWDLHEVSPPRFLTDIHKAHHLLEKALGFAPFFRYPYLREGNTVEKRERIQEAIKSLGYQNGYVTIDNYDWYMDSLFQKAIRAGRKIDFVRLGEIYVNTLLACIEFYDHMAMETLGRSPKHVLLLHENDLAALYVGHLIQALRTKGWELITPEEAYQDPIATLVPPHLMHQQGRVAAIAKMKGWQGSFSHPSESESYLDEKFEEARVFGPILAPQ